MTTEALLALRPGDRVVLVADHYHQRVPVGSILTVCHRPGNNLHALCCAPEEVFGHWFEPSELEVLP